MTTLIFLTALPYFHSHQAHREKWACDNDGECNLYKFAFRNVYAITSLKQKLTKIALKFNEILRYSGRRS